RRGPIDDDGGRARALGEVLGQIIGARGDLVLRNGHLEIEHHAHHRAPTLGGMAGAHAVDVVAAATQRDHGRFAGSLGKIRLRLLGQGRRCCAQESCRDDGSKWAIRHGSSENWAQGPQRSFQYSAWDASLAPSASDASFIHTILESTCSRPAKVPNPQSTPAMTFSRPTALAYCTMRSATSSGCSTKFEVESITPGMTILPSGSLTSFHTFHSC